MNCVDYSRGWCNRHGTPAFCKGETFACDYEKIRSKQGSTTGGITMDEVLKKIQGGTKMEINKIVFEKLANSEWYAKELRKVGEWLIKNADAMAAKADLRKGIDISAKIDPNRETEVLVMKKI